VPGSHKRAEIQKRSKLLKLIDDIKAPVGVSLTATATSAATSAASSATNLFQTMIGRVQTPTQHRDT
jgi:hypothetical protein